MSSFKRKRSTKQIIDEIVTLTDSKGWAFVPVKRWSRSVPRPKVKGHPQQHGKRDVVAFVCRQSKKTLEVHIDRFAEGKIRFVGIDPFTDTGPFHKAPRTKVDLDKATDEQKTRLKELVDAGDREGVIAYLKDIGLMPKDEVVPHPDEIRDEDLPNPDEIVRLAAQAQAEIAQGANPDEVFAKAGEQAKALVADETIK